MSKFFCECGNLISDVDSSNDSLVVSESELDEILAGLGTELAQFVRLNATDRLKWLEVNFSEDYPSDSSDEEVIEDFITQQVINRSRFMITCASCGRLHLQSRPQATEYCTFLPTKLVSGNK